MVYEKNFFPRFQNSFSRVYILRNNCFTRENLKIIFCKNACVQKETYFRVLHVSDMMMLLLSTFLDITSTTEKHFMVWSFFRGIPTFFNWIFIYQAVLIKVAAFFNILRADKHYTKPYIYKSFSNKLRIDFSLSSLAYHRVEYNCHSYAFRLPIMWKT